MSSFTFRYLKWIIVPGLIGFILLLILSNVDFNNADDTEQKSAQQQSKIGSVSSPTLLTCIPQTKSCGLYCYGVEVTDSLLRNYMENEYKNCSGLDLTLENCSFLRNTMLVDTWKGSYKLSNLTIRNCGLNAIASGAFNYSSVNNLEMLTFINTSFTSLNVDAFRGLIALKYFKLVNTQTTAPFEAFSFLKPVSDTLQQLELRQVETTAKCDPTPWLGGAPFNKLQCVNLSGTNITDTLTSQTFHWLSAVQELNLASCAITSFSDGTFNAIEQTLKRLDLSNNLLKSLDTGFIAAAVQHGFRVALQNNNWDCSRTNCHLIEYIHENAVNITDEPKCMTPKTLQGVEVKLATIRCCEAPSTATSLYDKNTTMQFPTYPTSISPMSCRSPYVKSALQQRKPWLHKDDVAVFTTLTVLGICISIALGTLSVYLFLRWRPACLRGNNRILGVPLDSKKVYLVPKNVRLSKENLHKYQELLNSLYWEVATTNIYEYMQFYEKPDQCVFTKAVHSAEDLPPSENAPAKPSRLDLDLSRQSTMHKNYGYASGQQEKKTILQVEEYYEDIF